MPTSTRLRLGLDRENVDFGDVEVVEALKGAAERQMRLVMRRMDVTARKIIWSPTQVFHFSYLARRASKLIEAVIACNNAPTAFT